MSYSTMVLKFMGFGLIVGLLASGCGLDFGGIGMDAIPPDDAEADTTSDSASATDSRLEVDGETGDSAESGPDTAVDAGADSAADAIADTSTDAIVDSPSDVAPDSPVVPVCKAGLAGTVDNITASGAIETGLLIHYQVGADYYSTAVPTIHTFTGENLPGQLVLYGREGQQFKLQNGATAVSKPFYIVNLGTLPTPECSGIGLKSQSCLAKVAKSFRCQFGPYLETIGCPAPVTFTVKPATDFYQNLTPGHHIVLVHLTCP